MHISDPLNVALPTNPEQTAELRYLAALVGARQITQSVIASATGIHQSQISRILSGQIRRSSKNVQELCKYAISLRREVRYDDGRAAEALSATILRVWDGTQHHADALIELLEALRAVQNIIRNPD
ncbi:MAG TPA: helix-turn-helix transcriptional regulator [Paraburkholderia sp.]